jgi:hypothetical protein
MVSRAVRARPASWIGHRSPTKRACAIRSNPAPTGGVARLRVARNATACIFLHGEPNFVDDTVAGMYEKVAPNLRDSLLQGCCRISPISSTAARSDHAVKSALGLIQIRNAG